MNLRAFAISSSDFHPGYREDLERPAEVENLHLLVDKDPDAFSLHTPSAVVGESQIATGLKLDAILLPGTKPLASHLNASRTYPCARRRTRVPTEIECWPCSARLPWRPRSERESRCLPSRCKTFPSRLHRCTPRD